jgi:fatty acid-binding protein DegV
LVSLERVRGQKKGYDRILTMAQEMVAAAPVHLAVSHALDREQADQLLAQAQTRLNCQDSFIADLALSLAVHFGPGTVGLATYPADTSHHG